MGKYMRRNKSSGDFAVMEVSPKSSFGVCTRAKTLALRQLQNSPPFPDDSFSFLQLRSRRLEKFLPPAMKPKTNCKLNAKPAASSAQQQLNSVEVSFGENMLDFEEINRKVRETTPTSLIRNSNDIGTPGSSTRPSISTTTNCRISVHRNIPTTMEMDDFFRGVEQSQLKLFTEKYNYDPVNDCPLPGRYDWVKLE